MDYQDIEILIIEDNHDDAELTIRALKKHHLGSRIIHLIDGEDALDFIRYRGKYATRNKSSDLRVIFLDLKMPKINGLEVLHALKADPAIKNVPVVILTSSAEDPDVKKAYDLGANSYIVKPVEFNAFADTIGNLGLYWMLVNKV